MGTKALIKLLELEKAKKKKKQIRKMIHELKVKTVFSITSLKSLIFFPKNMISTLKGKKSPCLKRLTQKKKLRERVGAFIHFLLLFKKSGNMEDKDTIDCRTNVHFIYIIDRKSDRDKQVFTRLQKSKVSIVFSKKSRRGLKN